MKGLERVAQGGEGQQATLAAAMEDGASLTVQVLLLNACWRQGPPVASQAAVPRDRAVGI